MSQNERLDSLRYIDGSESTGGNLYKLAERAREAYERKETKACLDLTRTMLLIDPDNADAQWMRSSIQSEMHRDLENTREFLRQAQTKDNSEELLTTNPAKVESPLNSNIGDVHDWLSSEAPPRSSAPRLRTRWVVGASVFLVLGIVAVGLAGFRKSNGAHTAMPVSPTGASSAVLRVSTARGDILIPLSAEMALPRTSVPDVLAVPAPALPRIQIIVSASVATPAVKLPPPPIAAVAGNGTLAVSSPTSVDIYKDDAYLGSVPISIELPSGTHTLEYRHGSLRKSVTHVINSNEITKANITFPVTVQINSKPWANVFVDGVERKPLGQTPLGNVQLAIGSVLVFENPKFQAKRYRVTGNETGIQIVFP